MCPKDIQLTDYLPLNDFNAKYILNLQQENTTLQRINSLSIKLYPLLFYTVTVLDCSIGQEMGWS